MLTKSEEQIMELLWSKGTPLTSSEIVSFSEDKTWKDSYAHLLINSLLEKNMIKITGFKKATKNYARAFAPVVSREEFLVSALINNNLGAGVTNAQIIKTLILKISDKNELNDIVKAAEDRISQI